MAHNAAPGVAPTPDAPLVPSPAFYNALTLAERRRCLLHGGDAFEFDPARAERRFAAWCSQAPFEDRERLLQRVRGDGLELAEFRAILGVSAPALRDALREPPSWVTTLEQALAPCAHGEPRPFSASDPSLGLLNPFLRLAQRSRDRLVAGLARTRRAHTGLDFDPYALTASWFCALYPTVLGMLCRTLVLELHVASVEGRLEGSTSRARFEAFCARLAESEVARGLFEEYPVLARKVLSRTEQWVDFAVELMERLGRDLALAAATFAPGTRPGRLVDVNAGAGDSHRGGRRVIILTFESGMKLVYKPRRLGVDVHFLGLVEWFNGRGSHPPLRVARALDRGSYGWQEFVSAEPCRSEEEVHRFYQTGTSASGGNNWGSGG